MGWGPYASDVGNAQPSVRPMDPFASYYETYGGGGVSLDQGRSKMWLKPRRDGSMPGDGDVINLAKTTPVGDVFVTDAEKQIEYRTSSGKA